MPAGFTVHPKLKKLMAGRVSAVETGEGIDWGCGEMLALGTLLLEGSGVRFTGQDVERGTFSHRHAVLHDYQTGETYTPLQHVSPEQGPFTILNSMLSEAAVVGFEWGFALGRPAKSGRLGGAVRRLRQRRPDHHRPSHGLRREQVALPSTAWS